MKKLLIAIAFIGTTAVQAEMSRIQPFTGMGNPQPVPLNRGNTVLENYNNQMQFYNQQNQALHDSWRREEQIENRIHQGYQNPYGKPGFFNNDD